MSAKQHFNFFIQGVIAWAAFWVAGLPHYYQQYSPTALGIGCVLLSVALSLVAIVVLQRGKPENRMNRAIWISVYFSVPFVVLDVLYCGVYLGRGVAFLWEYWYLSVFYISVWLTFVPTAILLRKS